MSKLEKCSKESDENVEINDDESVKSVKCKRKRESVNVKVDAKEKVYKVKYIGETGRSGNERGKEHSTDYERLEERSHLLRHYLLKHQDIKLEELEFGMRIRCRLL